MPHLAKPLHYNKDPTQPKKKKKKEIRWWQNVDRVGNSDDHRKQSDTAACHIGEQLRS